MQALPEATADSPEAIAGAAGGGPHRLDFACPTEFWGPYKFRQRYGADGAVNGWEASCNCDSHMHGKNNQSRCRATRRFQPNGGVERTERMLKWWFLQASSLASHKAHLDLPFPDPSSLPTFQELDALLACAQ